MSSSVNQKIVAITGSFGSGSSEIAKIFKDDYKYHLIKVSDFLKKEAKKKKIPGLDDESSFWKKKRILQDLGNELRLKYGNGYLINYHLDQEKKAGMNKSIVIDCVKNPGEIIALRKHPNAYVIAVNAPKNVRWERNKGKNTYNNELSEFEKDDERDKNEGLPHGQNVQKCVDLADIYIKNEKHWKSWRVKEEFKNKLEQYIKIINEPGWRTPSNEELFMNNAYHTSLLSTCMKRQVGAIIVLPRGRSSLSTEEKKWYVIASGYNDVPESENSCRIEHGKCYRDLKWENYQRDKHCPSCGGSFEKLEDFSRVCPKCGVDFVDSLPTKALDICRAIHAEESAILQTSRLGGMSLEGAAIYTTTHPCLLCAKKIISTGIEWVFWLEAYPDADARDMLVNAGIKLVEFEGVKTQAFYKLFHRIS